PSGMRRSEKSEGARDARVPEDPRTSTSRDIEAIRIAQPQVRRFPRRPARCLEACSAEPPVGASPFRSPGSLQRSAPCEETYPPLWGLGFAGSVWRLA